MKINLPLNKCLLLLLQCLSARASNSLLQQATRQIKKGHHSDKSSPKTTLDNTMTLLMP